MRIGLCVALALLGGCGDVGVELMVPLLPSKIDPQSVVGDWLVDQHLAVLVRSGEVWTLLANGEAPHVGGLQADQETCRWSLEGDILEEALALLESRTTGRWTREELAIRVAFDEKAGEPCFDDLVDMRDDWLRM
jgi:hypothetical protein